MSLSNAGRGGDGHCCRLLVGMQTLPQEQLRASMSVLHPEQEIDQATAMVFKRQLAQEFRDQLMVGIPSNEDEAGLRRLAAQIQSGKLAVKLFLRHPLHAKLYLHFRSDPLNPKIGYLGSSNLTFAGLATVLDPTCGSGAFLFAALRILETLYSDCLARMRQFVDEAARDNQHPEKYKDFKGVLAQLAKHPGERYFILKSIIINNLFGVDIMEEAVEICKLRLFLKLVAQVERVEQIEPLPDIDFNIRAGNTLVGYVSLDEVRNSQKGTLGFGAEEVERIEEEAQVVEKSFDQFRAQQTRHGGKVTAQDKQQLRERLSKLGGELDRYLAGEYGVNPEKPRLFAQWKSSHQPFHWLTEFYGIMRQGGFDVVIGNPPYLEKSKLGDSYVVRGLSTLKCRDIYAWVVERVASLRCSVGRFGLIIPVSMASSGSFEVLRDVVSAYFKKLWLSHFANRPGQLFAGAQNRLTILLGANEQQGSCVYSTRYYRWDAKNGERDKLFPTLRFVALGDLARRFHGLYPKCGQPEAIAVLQKTSTSSTVAHWTGKSSKFPVYWVRVPGYFCQFFLDPPKAKPESGGPARERGEVNSIHLPDDKSRRMLHCLLNSSTYFQFYCAYTDGRHINPSDVNDFPFDPNAFPDSLKMRLEKLSKDLESGMQENTSYWRKSGLLIESVDSHAVKPIIDEIDTVLAQHYGFTPEELEFIINYDIKYRMGQDGGGEDEES